MSNWTPQNSSGVYAPADPAFYIYKQAGEDFLSLDWSVTGM